VRIALDTNFLVYAEGVLAERARSPDRLTLTPPRDGRCDVAHEEMMMRAV
jgi:hypothetical protein